MTATEWAQATADGTVALPGAIADLARAVRVVDAGVFDPYRPTGARFGILVHALLAHVPLDATAEQVARLAAVQARMLRSSDEERAAAAAMVDRALKHALLDRARAARAAGRSCRREVSLGVVVDGVVVDGQADLLFDDGDRWLVVDFKTDVEITGSEASLPAPGGALHGRGAAGDRRHGRGRAAQGVSREDRIPARRKPDRRRGRRCWNLLETTSVRSRGCSPGRPGSPPRRFSSSRSGSAARPRCSAS